MTIENGCEFKAVLKVLNKDQRSALCDALKDQGKLPQIIKFGWQFKEVLEVLKKEEQRTAVVEALKNQGKLSKDLVSVWQSRPGSSNREHRCTLI